MAEPLKIVHLSTGGGGGASIAALRQHEALRAAGAESRLLTAVPAVEGRRDDCAVTPPAPLGLGERLRRRLPLWPDTVASLDARIEHARRDAATGEFFEAFSTPYSRCFPETHSWLSEAGLVHLHWVSGYVDYRRFFAAVRQPLVWTLHDQHPYLGGFHYAADRDTAPSLRALDDECRAIKQSALARCRQPIVVVGNSRWNTAAARASGFFPHSTRFETIYYPLDTTRFAPGEKTAARIALGLPPDRHVVGFACNDLANRRKGFADLLAALGRIEATGAAPVALLSFGLTPPEETRAQLRSPWRHLGYLQDDAIKATAFSAMDVFVIPSHAEAFGQTAIEALACGTPVIGANVGGIPEAMPEANRAFLFAPGDDIVLSHHLLALMTDAPLRRRLAAAGRRHVETQHSPVDTTRAWLDLYRATLAR